ncbi:acyltransferase family protein [Meiothermus hypogaeus]|uniref:Acyltransferase 3 domain-containing protein n=2 Tax=Meiothermus hypogaeus TaxID=884155 RepID=A0A511QZN9_9DEIN|nr:acyltransferase family protein [Meiothermus hypogaeus]RIH76908.1 Acyltransferase family protein [Meiothermus hypogaeus]GEM82843.1 hypothetical protein MHY01S_10090 [Meiothermus hypogaeus NBRC 106114]
MNKRIHYLDWLRFLAVFLGLVFHSGRPFDDWPWLIKGPELGWTTFFNEALTTVRLPLLFFVSGAATIFVLKKLVKDYTLDRMIRLLIPLGMGVLLIVPPQHYIVRISLPPSDPQHFNGSYWQFLSGPWLHGGTYPLSNLRTEHLWYLLYLFIFSLLALPIFLYLRSPGGLALWARLEHWFMAASWRVWLLVVIPAIGISLLPLIFRSHPGLVQDLENLLFFFFLYVLGFALFHRPRLLEIIFSQRKLFAWAGLVLVIGKAYLFTVVWEHDTFSPGISLQNFELYWLLRDLAALCVVFAALGYAHQYLNRPSPFLEHARHWVYPFYIWHQSVIVVLGYFVLKLAWPAWLLYGLLMLSALVVTITLSELVQHSALSRFLFGIHRRSGRKSATALSRTSKKML